MKSLQGKMAPRKEKEGGGVMSIKLGGVKKERDGGGAGGGGSNRAFKKGGFKNAFAPAGGQDDDGGEGMDAEAEMKSRTEDVKMEEADSDVTDEEDYYDPRRPTGCTPGCPGRIAEVKR